MTLLCVLSSKNLSHIQLCGTTTTVGIQNNSITPTPNFFMLWLWSYALPLSLTPSNYYRLVFSRMSYQFICSVMSNSLQPHELQHARPPCPSTTPRVHPNSCPSSQWCHPTISSSVVPFPSYPQSFPASGSFSNESALHIRWPKYWSFSFNISPSNEHSGLISFRMD